MSDPVKEWEELWIEFYKLKHQQAQLNARMVEVKGMLRTRGLSWARPSEPELEGLVHE